VAQTQTANGQTRSFGATLNPADWPQQATNDGLSSSTTGAGSGDLLSQTNQNEAGKVSYNIDQLGRQNGIGVVSMGSTTPLTTIFAFNSLEQMTAQGMPNNVEQDAGYDGANRLNQITAKNNANPALLNNVYQYGYDALGLTSSIVATVQGTATSQTLTHDAMGRLVSVTGGTSPGSWAYDGRGNLTSATVGGATKAYSYAAGNPEEVASTSVGGGPATSYGYDGNGNTTSIAGPGGLSEALSYDAQSRLVQVTLGSPITSTIAMAYNAFGQRAGYTVTPAGAGGPSLAEAFKYQGDQLAQVAYSGTSIPTPYTDTYVYTQDGTPLELLRQQQGSGTATPYWYVIDGQSNVVALTDQGGNVVDSYSYDQWGKPTSVQEAVPQQLRYAGYWYDGELGWYWLSVRSYDPALERFLQPDPSELEGLFSYVYAGDNPADRTDPTGLIATQPTTGCLLTGNNNVECNVQVGSAQWNNEVANGSTIITSLNGTSLSELVPLLCGNTARVCLISSRNLRHVGAADCGLLSFACDLVGNFVSGVRHILVYVIDGARILCDASICGDFTTIRNGPWYMKILAAGDIALTFVPVGGEALKAGEVLVRGGAELIRGTKLTAAAAEEEAAYLAKVTGGRPISLPTGCGCFPAETQVATPQGDKAIGTLRAGEQVLAENLSTGEVEPAQVQAVIDDGVKPTMKVGLTDGSSLQVTTNHPFYVDGGPGVATPRWVQAGGLQVGDRIRTASGQDVAVAALRYQTGDAHVYTLTVANDHDFFVGAARVLVHNCDVAALGLAAQDLNGFAVSVGGKTFEQWGGADWKSAFSILVGDGKTKFAFNLDGVDPVWKSISRAASGRGGATDFELLTLYQNKDALARTTWYLNGKVVPNPFGG